MTSGHRLRLHQYMILGAVSTLAPLGDACLSKGMATMEPISLLHPIALLSAIAKPWIVLGIVLLIGFFASYLTALSWADLTFVLPATAFGYVVTAAIARFWLGEMISLERWLGIIFISLGAGIVTRGPSLTRKREEIVTEDD